MKKVLLSLISVISLSLFITAFGVTGCSKDNTSTVTLRDTVNVCIPNIQGLWEGTFTSVSGYAINGRDYYFSLSLYPNGTCSYKSGTDNSTTFVYAAGTWSLTGTSLTFAAATLNTTGGASVNVVGSATFNRTTGTLSNGITSTNTPSTSGTWRMNKIN
jgi:hypothetical protein